MPSGAKETFTGANGATPSTTNITLAFNIGTGGGISIQSNQLRIRTGTLINDRTSIRLTGVSVANCEVEFDWTVLSFSLGYALFMIRANTAIDSGTGYFISLKPTDMELSKSTSYNGTDVVTYTHGFPVGSALTTRVAMFGSRIRVRTWLTSGSEPTSVWQIDWTDPGTALSAGAIGWTLASASSGSKDAFFDNFDVHDTITPGQATLNATGSITPAGALINRPSKKFAASITPTGALGRTRVVLKALAGSITPTGAFNKALVRSFAGSLTPTGVLRRSGLKRFTASVTSTATLRRTPAKRMTGSVTPVGAGVVMFIGRIFGRPGLIVMRLVQRAEVRIRHRKG